MCALMQQPSLLLKSSRRVRQADGQELDASTPKQFLLMLNFPIPLRSSSVKADAQNCPPSLIAHPFAYLWISSILLRLPQLKSASMNPCAAPVEHKISLIRDLQ